MYKQLGSFPALYASWRKIKTNGRQKRARLHKLWKSCGKVMGRFIERRPIEYRQVCAIARVLLLRTPSMTDAEWKAETKDTAAKQGYDEPGADMLGRALSAVEHAMKRTMGPRPVADHAPSASAEKPEVVPLTPAEWKAFADTIRSVLARSRAIAPTNVTPIALETLDISEHAALDQFYLECAGDRSAALRRFAELAIVREAGWDTEAIRADAGAHNLRADACYACRTRSRSLAWHHVIQIQHGGSNLLRNRVALCGPCHADIHPWMPAADRSLPGWSSLADLIPGACALLGSERKNEAS